MMQAMQRRYFSAALLYGMVYLGCHSAICFASGDTMSSATTSDSSVEKTARHRLDLTTLFFDEIDSNSATFLFAYTYNLNANSNVSFALPYQDPDVGRAGDSGIGDLNITFSYTPDIALNASPWVPKKVGSGISVLLPTADSTRMGSPDTTIITPFLGFVFPIQSNIAVYPSIAYTHSLKKTAIGTDIRLITAEIGMFYVTPYDFWISYFPSAIRDLETDDTGVNHRLTIGKQITRHFGISFDYSRIDRVNFTIDLPNENGFDKLYELNMHFTF